MAIVTTTGSVSDLLNLTSNSEESNALVLASHLNNFVNTLYWTSSDISDGYDSPVYVTQNLYKTRVSFPTDAVVTVQGSGFLGSSASINRILYDSDAYNWEVAGKATWSYSRGFSAGSISSLTLWNESETESFVINGSLKISDYGLVGTLKSSSSLCNGILFEQTGSITVGTTLSGKYTSLSYSDEQGNAISIVGNMPLNKIAPSDTLGGVFDQAQLFSGKDTFNVSDNSRAWYAFAGNDIMNGGALGDELYGGSGNDKLYGYAGNDFLFGDEGNDYLDGGVGDDYLSGGYGNDTYLDLLGDNVILDLEGHNKVATGQGSDLIITGWGRDTIDAGAGDDIIDAGGGANKVTGGAGADLFFFSFLKSGNVSTLLDFNSAEGDRLVLDSTVFTALPGVGDLSDHLVVGPKAKAMDADDNLIFDSQSQKLYYDADGNGGAAAVPIAILKGVADLSSGDIWIV